MTEYCLSRRAASDLEAIADHTIAEHGIVQARIYRDSLKSCFQQLASNPTMGRKAEQLTPGLRRFEHKSHIVFYMTDNDELRIVRILHSRMDVRRHL